MAPKSNLKAKPAARKLAQTTAIARRPAPVRAPAQVSRSAAPQVSNNLAALMQQDSGAGMEGADRDAYAIPFIRVIQDGSPQVKAGKPQYNPDAVPGMLVNTVTGELIDGAEGIIFVPCFYQRRFIQWGPRNSERGFCGEWLPEEVQEKLNAGEFVKSEDDGRIYVGEPNPLKSDRIVDTRNHFGLIITPEGSVSQAILALSSTQIKKSKQLMGILSSIRVNGVTPPSWLSKIRITVPAEQESNEQGSWYGYRVEHAGFIDDEAIYDAGKAFHDIIAAGQARVNYAEAGDDAEAAGQGKF